MSTQPLPLSTPPTRQDVGGIYGSGTDSSHARLKMVDAIGNLNQAVNGLQQIVGLGPQVSDLTTLVDGNLSFGEINGGTPKPTGNLQTELLKGTSPLLPNTSFTLTHTLGKIPNGFVVVQKSQVADFIGTATGNAWTTTTITLICNQASTGYVILVL